MQLLQRLTPITTLLVLVLVLPAAYGAGHGAGNGKGKSTTNEATELDATQVQISQLQQSDDGGATWTSGANVSHTEGDEVPFRLELEAAAAGSYTIEIEYTHTLTSKGVTAYGYTGLGGFEVIGNAVVAEHESGPDGVQAGQTTRTERVTVNFGEPGMVALMWHGTLALTHVSGAPLGPASISGARVHMRLRNDGSRNSPIQTSNIALNPEIDPIPDTCTQDCDVEPPCAEDCEVEPPCTEDCEVEPPCAEDCEVEPPCTEDCEVEPPCTEDCEVEPPCTEDCDVEPPCTEDCDVEPPCTEDCELEVLDPACQGTLRVSTVDAEGNGVGPSRALVGVETLELIDGQAELDTDCVEVTVALTQIPAGYTLASSDTLEATRFEAAGVHLAESTALVADGQITAVVFVLADASDSQPVAPVVDDQDPDQQPAEDGTGETPAEGEQADVIADREQEAPAPAPSGGDDVTAPAPAPNSDDDGTAPAPAPDADDDETIPALVELPRTGADTPVLLIVALALMAAGAAMVRQTRGTGEERAGA
ncbi:MAG: hypothetical protein R3343_01795 [Nitriliruptorales bacterium]|nr:hypothetical protein [Nitriliruptorales bacterium]